MWKIILLGFVVGYLLTAIYEFGWVSLRKRYEREFILRIKGIHVHHSMIGLGLLLIWIFGFNPFYLGAGTGVIVRHTRKEKKFAFIDRK